MRFAISLFLILAVLQPAWAKAAKPVISNARELTASIYDDRTENRPFAFEAVVTAPSRKHDSRLAIEDVSGYAMIHKCIDVPKDRLLAGDRVRLEGIVGHSPNGNNYAIAKKVSVLSHGTPPDPPTATFADINDGRHLSRVIRTTGTVLDSFRDEIDPRFVFLVLADGHGTTYVSSDDLPADLTLARRLVGATVSVTGLCTDYRHTHSRKILGYDIAVAGLRTVTILRPAPADPFDVPDLQTGFDHQEGTRINGFQRMKIRGRVIATWRRNRMIVQTGRNEFANIRLTEPSLPSCGDSIEAVGLPETDFYRWNLSRGSWRPTARLSLPDEPPRDTTAQALLENNSGQPQYAALLHGKTVRLVGRISGFAGDGNAVQRILLDCQGTPVAVDIGSNPSARNGLERDAIVEVTGVCVMETEPWSPHAPFPHIEGFFLVARSPEDITVLAQPPWWTVGKLLGVIGSLLAALLAFGVWTLALKRLADRRGRQLFREQIASASSELRIEERTRLAVELHDSISQNLTGISMQIDAADRQLERHPEKTRLHLAVASRTLDSCREELRNCIWDLRNQTLEEKDMDTVLRKALQPHLEGAKLQIRFAVPRARLSENTAHALIRIIRELATNAVRHGKASHIRIAGALEKDRLFFSVTDDGCGFDPENHPGTSDGHFGLQGIRERIRHLHGSFSISSVPGRGTKVTAKIPTHLGEGQNG